MQVLIMARGLTQPGLFGYGSLHLCGVHVCPAEFPWGSIHILTPTGTFDVQTADITTPGPSSVEVTCYFAEDSQAKGCRVDFHSQEGNATCSMTIDKGNELQAYGTFELPDGTYEILVYDIEADGSLSENPAYEHDEIVVLQGSSVSGL